MKQKCIKLFVTYDKVVVFKLKSRAVTSKSKVRPWLKSKNLEAVTFMQVW